MCKLFRITTKISSFCSYFNRMLVHILSRILNVSGSIDSVNSVEFFFSCWNYIGIKLIVKNRVSNIPFLSKIFFMIEQIQGFFTFVWRYTSQIIVLLRYTRNHYLFFFFFFCKMIIKTLKIHSCFTVKIWHQRYFSKYSKKRVVLRSSKLIFLNNY